MLFFVRFEIHNLPESTYLILYIEISDEPRLKCFGFHNFTQSGCVVLSKQLSWAGRRIIGHYIWGGNQSKLFLLH